VWLSFSDVPSQRKSEPKKTAAPMTTTLPTVSATLPEPAFAGALEASVLGVDETAALPAETVALEAGELPVPEAWEEPDVAVDEDDEVTVVRVVAALEDEDRLLLTALLLVLDPEALLDAVAVSLEPSVLTMMLSKVPDVPLYS